MAQSGRADCAIEPSAPDCWDSWARIQISPPPACASTWNATSGIATKAAEAYLAAGQGTAAAVEFQKILDHSGIVWNCWTGALAHLGVARANALQAKTTQGADADLARTRALAAYKFLRSVPF